MTHDELISVGRWPENLPKTYPELLEQQGAFIAHLLRRYNAVDHDIRDLFQEIWKQLQAADVLGKYAESLGSEPPEYVTTDEGMAFLGVTEDEFVALMDEAHIKVKGRNLWKFDPIVTLSHEHPRFLGFIGELPTPKASKKHFQGYLTRAVRNHFINWCRTRSRKHRERPGADMTFLAKNKKDEERKQNWEENIPAMTMNPDEEADLRTNLSRVAPALMSLDPACTGSKLQGTVAELTRRRTVAAQIEAERRGICPKVEPATVVEAAGHCILSDLEDGKTLREAILRLDVTSATKKTILRAIALG